MGNAGATIVKPRRRNDGTMRIDPRTIIAARFPNLSTTCPNTGAKTIDAKIMMVVVPPAVVNMWRML